MNQTQYSHTLTAAKARPDERASFIRRTYAHLAVAILAFTGIEAMLLSSPNTTPLVEKMIGGRYSWLIVLGCFMGVSWLANSLAQSRSNPGLQYLGLALFVVAEAVIFLPMLFIADKMTGSHEIAFTAGLMTLLLVAGLTATVFITKADFSFMRNALAIGGLLVLGLIVISIFTGFSLGLWFSGFMVAFAAGAILYTTSNILHHYGTEDHVAAALALFASVAMLFWYVLRILLAFANRD